MRGRSPTGATPCQAGRNRASAAGSTGSTSRRSRASDRRRRSAQDVGVAPLALRAAGPELAAEQRPGREQPLEGVLDDADRQPPATRRFRRQERPVGPRPAREQPVERVRRRSRGTPPARRPAARPRRRRGTAPRPRSAIQRSSPAIRTSHRASRRRRAPRARARRRRAALGPRRDLVGREVAEPPQQVVDLVGVVAWRSSASAWSSARGRRARPGRAARAAPPGRAARAAGRGRASAPAPAARPAAHRPRTCRRRCSRTAASSRTATAVAVSTAWTAISRRCDAAQHLPQRGQVEDVREALAVRLDEDRERAVAAGHGQQVGGPLALLPQRRARAGPAARQQQRPRRVLAEARREQRRCADAARRPGPRPRRGRGTAASSTPSSVALALGQADRDAVVGPDGLDLEPELLARSAPRAPAPTARGRGRRTASAGTSRQSPSSSRKRSTTIRRSVGRAPVASRSSSR